MREIHPVRIVWLVVLAAGCTPAGPAPHGPAAPAEAPPEVEVVTPQRKSLARVVEQPGGILAYEETELFARLPGYVRLPYDAQGRILSDIGRKVRGPRRDSSGQELEPGEVLAELVVPEMVEEANQKQALVRQARADVTQAQKALAAAEAYVMAAEAAVVEARALQERWDSELKRIAGLVRSGAIEAQVRDETQNQAKAAGARVLSTEAAVRKAKADRDKAEADVRVAEARVAVAEAEARRLEALLVYAKIQAPYDGIVTRRRVNTGDYVHPGGGKGDWLFTVARLDPVRVVVAVPEADAGLVREKAEVKLIIPALSSSPVSDTVTRTSWALEPGARTLRAEIDLPNKDSRLRPGMYVSARITGQLPEEWTLPATALAKQGDTMVCFRIEDGKAVRTPVQVGHGDGPFIQVPRRQKPGSPGVWEEWSGKEMVAVRAVGLSDGQLVQMGSEEVTQP